MAAIDFDLLKQPLSDADPCGPDLEYDDDYLNFLANLEGVMPTSFFQDEQPFSFETSELNLEDSVAGLLGLLSRTRDLRLLGLLAKLLILGRDLHAFARAVDTMAALLDAYWDAVFPRAEEGDFSMRAAAIATLNESTVVFSLQYCSLCESRRIGPASFRSYLYALREAEPRPGENAPTEATLLQALRDAEEQTQASRESLDILRKALLQITAIWTTRADYLSAPKLSNVGATLARMLAFIDLALPRAAPAESAAALGEEVSESATARRARPGRVSSAADAVAALAAAIDYFVRKEPSSPVLPLVAQAQHLLGKSFIDVLQILMPDHVGAAAFQIGGKQFFPLPVQRLADVVPTVPPYGDADAGAPDAALAEGSEGWSSWSPGEGDPTADAERSAAASEAAPASSEASSDSPAPTPRQQDLTHSFSAADRAAAMDLLDQVTAWLKKAEPSSPVPWLIERARALADRDFLSVLRSVMPADALVDTEAGS